MPIRVIIMGLLLGITPCVQAQVPEDMILIRYGEELYYIDRYEVTVSQFQAFDPDYEPAYEYFTDSNMPATAITFDKARAYCVEKHKRLPTSEEWQLACRGQTAAEYSYGSSFDRSKARSGRRIWTDGPKAVGSFDPNEFGLYDMSGNVWEWVDNGETGEENRSVLGGSWVDGPRRTKCVASRNAAPSVAAVNYGFRCARSVTEADRSRMARERAEEDAKAQAAAEREADRVKARLEAEALARRAEVDSKAQRLLEIQQAEQRAKKARQEAQAAAFNRLVEGMVPIGEGLQQARFYIDPLEVSVADFRSFDPSYSPDEFSSLPEMPATGLDFGRAVAYCESVGKRLPTREEWGAACFAGSGRLYAYGPTYDQDKARTGRSWYDGATAGGTGTPNGKGMFDTVGNVWEWVDTYYGGAQALRSVMGGSWVDGADRAKCTGESWARPTDRRANVGFRCVVSGE